MRSIKDALKCCEPPEMMDVGKELKIPYGNSDTLASDAMVKFRT